MKKRNNLNQVITGYTDEQITRLERIATERMKATGKAVSRNELIREAVDRFIEKESETE